MDAGHGRRLGFPPAVTRRLDAKTIARNPCGAWQASRRRVRRVSLTCQFEPLGHYTFSIILSTITRYMAIEDNTKIEYAPSCTVDEAVAKMLGWLRGMYRDRLVSVNEYGIPLEKLERAHSLGGPLIEQLNDLRVAAQNALSEALASDASPEVIQQREEDGRRCEEQAALAYKYHLAIVDELAKDSPALRIDKAVTERTGEPYITLRSLDEWAWDTYKVAINGDRQPEVRGVSNSDENADSESPALDNSQQVTPTRYNNLLTTFAFLVDAYLENRGLAVKHADGSPNISAISTRLSEMAAKANKGIALHGQGDEAIKGRIEEAIRIRRSKLPNR